MGTVQPAKHENARSRVETVIDAFIVRIDRGLIRPGDRLPSIRTASQAFSVSKNTIVEAYDRLVAAGQIESRPGSGFYVTPHRPKQIGVETPARIEAVDIVW